MVNSRTAGRGKPLSRSTESGCGYVRDTSARSYDPWTVFEAIGHACPFGPSTRKGDKSDEDVAKERWSTSDIQYGRRVSGTPGGDRITMTCRPARGGMATPSTGGVAASAKSGGSGVFEGIRGLMNSVSY